KTSIFSHPVYLFLRKFSLQDSRGGSARDLPHPVAVIVGTSPSTTGIKAWIFREGRYQEAVYTASLSRP
ncbi:hypothetical protein OSK36_17465, partial [Escherichia coli]|nr:hypothetical protein [Escherichia coli]